MLWVEMKRRKVSEAPSGKSKTSMSTEHGQGLELPQKFNNENDVKLRRMLMMMMMMIIIIDHLYNVKQK